MSKTLHITQVMQQACHHDAIFGYTVCVVLEGIEQHFNAVLQCAAFIPVVTTTSSCVVAALVHEHEQVFYMLAAGLT
jgi:thiosulfate reductase cytochrome b subunit